MELGRRLWHEAEKDELLGRAAQLSYYVLLALFPTLIVLTAAMGLFSVQNFMPELMAAKATYSPKMRCRWWRDFCVKWARVAASTSCRWAGSAPYRASSSGVTAIMEALNVVYDVKEDSRPFWRVRLTAILLTIGLVGFVILSFRLCSPVAAWGSGCWIRWLESAFTWAWILLQWPVVID